MENNIQFETVSNRTVDQDTLMKVLEDITANLTPFKDNYVELRGREITEAEREVVRNFREMNPNFYEDLRRVIQTVSTGTIAYMRGEPFEATF